MSKYYILLVTLLISASCFAQDYSSYIKHLEADQDSPIASIEDAAFIEGYWIGEAFGGTFEEIWSAPNQGTMLGMFKLVADEAVNFYELMTISAADSSLVFGLKHFSPDLTGWEEKDESLTFPLVDKEENMLYFDGYTFEKVDDQTLHVYLEMGSKKEEIEIIRFIFNRRP